VGGLNTQVQSWLGNGQNMPVTADQLRAALSDEHVRALAQHFGVDPQAALIRSGVSGLPPIADKSRHVADGPIVGLILFQPPPK
jgi:uncharacterized protein YidB (DUF937 family)